MSCRKELNNLQQTWQQVVSMTKNVCTCLVTKQKRCPQPHTLAKFVGLTCANSRWYAALSTHQHDFT